MKYRKRKRMKGISVLLICLMLVEAIAVTEVRAGEPVGYDISEGDVVISEDGDYIITGTTDTYTIRVDSGVNANITLDNVSVTNAATAIDAPFTIVDNSSGNVTVTLRGENKLISNAVNCAGLQKVGSGEGIGTLTIQGDGSLVAAGGGEAAGIGGGNGGIASGYGSASNIIIHGGTITATGGYWAAGIGGAMAGSASNIVIDGGNVTATGGSGGAGIGGGSGGIGSNIRVNGGIVTATAENGGDAIDGADSRTDWSGLVFLNGQGFVCGDSLELTEDWTISSGCSLTVEEGQILTVGEGVTLTVAGTVANTGTIIQYGEIAIVGSGSVNGNTPQKKAAGILLDKSEMSLFIDDTAVLTAETEPKATFEDVIWNCDNEEVITLVTEGKRATLTANKAGRATVTVTVGAFSAVCEVEVGKLTGAAEISVKDIYYGREPSLELQSTNGTENAVIEYKSLDEANAVYTGERPELPGNYSVRVTFPETDKYLAVETTAVFKITYLPKPEQPYKISGTKGENGFFISSVNVTPADGYLISDSAGGAYRSVVTFATSGEDVKIYLMNGWGEKTDAVEVGTFKIDGILPQIGVEDQSVCYGDIFKVNVSDDNLSGILVNGRNVEFTGTSAVLSLDAKNGREEYQITAVDLAGNKKTVNISVVAAWMKSGVIPEGLRIRLIANWRYTLGGGAWKVSGDATIYGGEQTFYVDSDGEYIFTRQ